MIFDEDSDLASFRSAESETSLSSSWSLARSLKRHPCEERTKRHTDGTSTREGEVDSYAVRVRSNIRRARRVRPLREPVAPVTVRIPAQADSLGPLPCIVRAAAPLAGSSHTSFGKLAVRLGQRETLLEVNSTAAFALHDALVGRSTATAELTRRSPSTATLVVRTRPRPRLA